MLTLITTFRGQYPVSRILYTHEIVFTAYDLKTLTVMKLIFHFIFPFTMKRGEWKYLPDWGRKETVTGGKFEIGPGNV